MPRSPAPASRRSAPSLDQLKRQAASTSDQDVQLRALEREAKAQRDLFESYLAKYREATARDSIAAAPADARIISRAAVSNVPYFPKKIPIVLIVALGMLSLSTAFVVTNALLSSESYRPARCRLTTALRPPPARSPNARTRASDRLPPAANLPAPAPMPSVAPEAPQAVAVSTTPAHAAISPAGLTIDDIAAGFA